MNGAITSGEKPRVEHIIMPDWIKHGYATNPRARAYVCAQENLGCDDADTEPQSVEFPCRNFPEDGPPDGQLASGGHARFRALDRVTTPNGQPWPATPLTAGAPVRFRWWLTAIHKTLRWEYWITKDGWNQDAPLARNQLELLGRIEWPCPGGGWRCNMPVDDVHHCLYLPEHKQGRHIIYGLWYVGDTINAFASTMDVNIQRPL